jgi:tetratricopeptide (TPR) repeat protein
MHNKLQNIVYISVPDDLDRQVGDFRVDPDRLLPVESSSGSERYDLQDLSWEQIVAGMLKILAYAPDHEDADYYREFVLAVSPDLVQQLTTTGILKTQNGDHELAEEIFLALVGLQPNEPRALVNLALLYEAQAKADRQRGDTESEQQRIDSAFELYHRTFELDDVPPEAHLNAGFFYANNQNFDQARNHLAVYVEDGDDQDKVDEAAALLEQIEKQSLADTQFKEAFDFIRLGKEEEGIERIREFLTKHPTVWNGWFMLGWGLRRLQRFEDAIAAFEKALEHGPKQTDTLNELAICTMETGDLNRSKQLLQEALTIEPENTKVISNLGIVSLRQENREEAEGYFRTVLEIDPEDRIARTYLQNET